MAHLSPGRGSSGSCASGSHKLQSSYRPGLESHLRLNWERIHSQANVIVAGFVPCACGLPARGILSSLAYDLSEWLFTS